MAQKTSVVSVKSLFIPCNFNKIPGVFGKISSPAKSDAQCCKDSFFTDRKASRFSGKSIFCKYVSGVKHMPIPCIQSFTQVSVFRLRTGTRGWTPARFRASRTSFPVVCSGKWRIKGSLASVDRSILGYRSEGDGYPEDANG